jgi:hypothetical protein
LFAVGLLASTGIQVLAGNSGATKGSGTWTKTGSLNTARDFHSATLLQSGEVLVAGALVQVTVSPAPSCTIPHTANGKVRAA